MRDALLATLPHSTATVPAIQLDTMAQLPSDSHTTLHKLLHVIQNGTRLPSRLEGLQS